MADTGGQRPSAERDQDGVEPRQGVHELQEAGWLSETGMAGAPRVPALGIYPTVETLVAQAVLMALAIAAAGILYARVRRTAAAESSGEHRGQPVEAR